MTSNINTIEQILDLHKSGQSIRSIANIVGLDKSKVQRIIKKALEEEYDDTADVSEDDTSLYLHETECTTIPFDTVIQSKTDANHRSKSPVSHQKYYTKAEIVSISEQIWRYKHDLNDFITYMSILHDGCTSISLGEYESFPKRAKRMIQAAKFITDQIGIDHKELLVTHVLHSISDATLNTLLHGSKSTYSDDLPSIEILSCDTEAWKDSIEEDFFHTIG